MRYSRQNKILELINDNIIETQEQLMDMLANAGFSATQSTVSRDIKELQLSKVLSADGRYRYSAAANDDKPISERFIKIFRETIVSYNSANNLIVVKTLSGCGNAAAEAVDCMELKHVIGSVAGDNTMLIVVDDEKNVDEILNLFELMISRRKQSE